MKKETNPGRTAENELCLTRCSGVIYLQVSLERIWPAEASLSFVSISWTPHDYLLCQLQPELYPINQF